MITTFQKGLTAGKNVCAAIIVALLFVCAFAPAASAQTYYYSPYQPVPRSNAEIQVLLNQLYTLMAQLQALQSQVGYVNTYTPGYTYQHKYEVKDTYKSYDVEVETDDIDVDDDEATFYGEVDLDNAPYAYVWFAYGEDGDMDEKTKSIKMTDDDDFEIDVDDLDEDERYYVRAVAEDPSGFVTYGNILAFTSGEGYDDDDDDGDIPDAQTQGADHIDEDSAELQGKIAMNDFDDGRAFFVYGEDEDAVEDVEDEDTYGDIDEEGDDLQKIQVASSFDGTRTFWATVFGLNEDTDHYFRICVEYEDDDGDETLECGDVDEFTTDED